MADLNVPVLQLEPFSTSATEEREPQEFGFKGILVLAAGTREVFDLKTLPQLYWRPRWIYLDNSLGTTTLVVSTQAMSNITIGPGYQAVLPLLMSADNRLFFAGAGTIRFSCSAGEHSAAVWSSAGGAGGSTIVAGLFGNNADAVAPVATGNIGADAYQYAYDSLNNVWSRVRINPATGGTILAANNTDSLIASAIVYGSNAGNSVPVIAAQPNDTVGNASNALDVNAFNDLFNGTTWDRQRGNFDTGALITLAAQGVGTVTSADQINYNGRGANVVMDLTVFSGAGNVTLTVQGKDAASGKYYTLDSGAALVATGTQLVIVYPGVPPTTATAPPLPRVWRVSVAITATAVVTGTVGASVIL